MISLPVLYIGGTPYPVIETFIVLTIITFGSAILFGLRFDSRDVEVVDDDEALQ